MSTDAQEKRTSLDQRVNKLWQQWLILDRRAARRIAYALAPTAKKRRLLEQALLASPTAKRVHLACTQSPFAHLFPMPPVDSVWIADANAFANPVTALRARWAEAEGDTLLRLNRFAADLVRKLANAGISAHWECLPLYSRKRRLGLFTGLLSMRMSAQDIGRLAIILDLPWWDHGHARMGISWLYRQLRLEHCAFADVFILQHGGSSQGFVEWGKKLNVNVWMCNTQKQLRSAREAWLQRMIAHIAPTPSTTHAQDRRPRSSSADLVPALPERVSEEHPRLKTLRLLSTSNTRYVRHEVEQFDSQLKMALEAIDDCANADLNLLERYLWFVWAFPLATPEQQKMLWPISAFATPAHAAWETKVAEELVARALVSQNAFGGMLPTKRALAWLAQRRFIPFPRLMHYTAQMHTHAQHKVGHTLASYAVLSQSLAVAMHWGATRCEVRSELQAAQHYSSQGRIFLYRPDGYICLEWAGHRQVQRRHFMIELDGWRYLPLRRAWLADTSAPARSRGSALLWQRKLLRFAHYCLSQQWAFRYDALPNLLVITEHVRNIRHLERAFLLLRSIFPPVRIFATTTGQVARLSLSYAEWFDVTTRQLASPFAATPE